MLLISGSPNPERDENNNIGLSIVFFQLKICRYVGQTPSQYLVEGRISASHVMWSCDRKTDWSFVMRHVCDWLCLDCSYCVETAAGRSAWSCRSIVKIWTMYACLVCHLASYVLVWFLKMCKFFNFCHASILRTKHLKYTECCPNMTLQTTCISECRYLWSEDFLRLHSYFDFGICSVSIMSNDLYCIPSASLTDVHSIKTIKMVKFTKYLAANFGVYGLKCPWYPSDWTYPWFVTVQSDEYCTLMV